MIPAGDLFRTYQQAEKLLADGELKKAADLCKSLLNSNPDFAYGYHLMSSLFRATGSYDQALLFAQMAVERDPNVALFHMQHGQALFALSRNQEAAAAFEKAYQCDPTNALALLLKADAIGQLGEFEAAAKLFQRARDLADIPEIDEHEGLCMVAKGDTDRAEALFDRLISRQPDYFFGHIHKGKILFEKKHYAQAEACYARALKLNPKAHEALHGMALINEGQDRLDEAISCAFQAVNANPASLASVMLLGLLLMRQRKAAAAEQVFRQAILLAPENVYVLHGLANVLIQQKKREEALPYVDQVLAKKPDHPVMKYFRALLSGGQMETAPKEYVHELFDAYADTFDHHLQKRLAYKTPAVVADAIRALPGMKGRTGMSLLDLGCGTGLGAEALKDITQHRIGVDLSPKMLEKARTKQLYEALFSLDICEFMTGYEHTFDIVTAMDVLVYIGNLSPFFKAARNVMASGGALAFTIEKGPDGDTFRLNNTGRYTHSVPYILSLAKEEGYEVLAQEDVVLRTESDKPVQGCIFILKKMPMH